MEEIEKNNETHPIKTLFEKAMDGDKNLRDFVCSVLELKEEEKITRGEEISFKDSADTGDSICLSKDNISDGDNPEANVIELKQPESVCSESDCPRSESTESKDPKSKHAKTQTKPKHSHVNISEVGVRENDFSEDIRKSEDNKNSKDIRKSKDSKNSDKTKSLRYNIVGPGPGMKHFIWAGLYFFSHKSIVFVLKNELEVRNAKRALQGFGISDIREFTEREYNLVEIDASGRDREMIRLGTLSGVFRQEKSVYLVNASAAMTKLMPPEIFAGYVKKIKVGDRIAPDILAEDLVNAGYERTTIAEAPGLFARRGEILDFVLPEEINRDPENRRGIRLSYFDDEIEEIRVFNLFSQRTVGKLEEVQIYPAREIIADKDKRQKLAEDISLFESPAGSGSSMIKNTALQEDIEKLKSDLSFKSIDKYIHLIYPGAASFLDYFDGGNTLLILDELKEIKNSLEAGIKSFYHEFTILLEQGKVSPVSEKIMFSPQEIMLRLNSFRKIFHFSYLGTMDNGVPGGKKVSIHGKQPGNWRGNEIQIQKDFSEYREMGLDIFIGCTAPERVKKLKNLLTSAVTILQIDVQEGFEYPGAAFVLLGESNLFASGKRRRSGKRTSGGGIDLFSDLKPGELVVHDVQGIGIFRGLETLRREGGARDYLKIEYAGGDALYISTDNLHRIQKYVGSEGRAPRLSKLGGKEWTRMKERARNSIRVLATDLVKLYAERAAIKGHVFVLDTVWQKDFEDGFPYELTQDQERSIHEIKEDMESEKVMDRLLCGDVGFGKTEVAFRAMFKAVMDGKQALMLVPTTILATQHYETLKDRIRDFPVNLELLNRFVPDKSVKRIKKRMAEGLVDIVIGTHMLLSEDVKLKDLGLLVVDEEQRFGVDHKEMIKSKFSQVDVLTLTATPIPRTLHMSLTGIRDISVLDEPPPERRAVQIYVMEYDEQIIQNAMLREISRKGQVFYLYNDTRKIGRKALEIEEALPGIRVGVAHGRMNSNSLEKIMEDFNNKEYDVLVCTTIIESGLDIPNVNTIIIEGADKLGLAQLYQLKGRVGRSERQAYGYLTYTRDKTLSETAQKRLAAIRDFTELGSGLKIALRDLEVRGAGNILGAEQHGHLDSVGFDMYSRMLREEVAIQSGSPLKEEPQALVDINIDAYISSDYISGESERMDMYRKIAAVSTYESWQDVLEELEDRYGEIPDKLLTLTRIAYIRSMGGLLGFERIKVRGTSVILSYAGEHIIDTDTLEKVKEDKRFFGKLIFYKGKRPYLEYKGAASDFEKTPEKIMGLIMALSGETTERQS